jgi:uncharacterized protein (TIGR03435 family)
MKTLAAVMLCSAVTLLAQEFEVASVKPSKPDSGGTLVVFPPGGGLRESNATLKDLIETAYQVRSSRVLFGPSWASLTRYDVIAPPGDGEPRVKLRALLKERFQLQVHLETGEIPVYSLVIAKNGIRTAGLRATSNAHKGIDARKGRMTGEAATMANLASKLANQVGRPVADDTGLKGNYNFTLDWAPDELGAADSSGPSIFTALQEQLGLRLEGSKGPVQTILIGHAEKPSED